jgi:DNA-binding NarL/FixJ family response regulator
LVRIFADQGVALLPLWQAMDWAAGEKTLSHAYLATIKTECRHMADEYPNYLKQPRRFASISDKELTVLRLMAQGRNNTQIAEELGVNLGTVKFHVKNIMQKLQAENRTVAVKVAQEEGLL